jgi:hypothetical protein
VRKDPMTASSLSMDLPRLAWRSASLSNCFVVARIRGAGVSVLSGLLVFVALRFANLDTQFSKQIVFVDVTC